MISIKSKSAVVFASLIGGTVLTSERVTADALDDFRATQAQNEANLREYNAIRAARLVKESERDAEFARFEAESRAPEQPMNVLEYRNVGPEGTRYIERQEYIPFGSGSYVEHYENW